LTSEAEAVIVATHAIYKEHMILLLDGLILWAWTSRETWSLAERFGPKLLKCLMYAELLVLAMQKRQQTQHRYNNKDFGCEAS